jgi:hypothetical protein
MMVIYEVNLTINKDVYPEFGLWLKGHVKEMLQLPGFIKAKILKPENEPLLKQEKLTVQYQLENRAFLELYFTQFATEMRKEGLSRFPDKFSSERRIFEIEEHIAK